MHTKEAAAAGETPVGSTWSPPGASPRCSPRPSRPRSRSTEEGTRLADAHHGVSDETWTEVRKHYDDEQIAALVFLVAMINAANRLNVIVRNQGGSYEPGMFASAST